MLSLQESKRQNIKDLCKDTLSSSYVNIVCDKIILNDNIADPTTTVQLFLHEGPVEKTIKGRGSGFVDATYNTLRKSYEEYCSLENINLGSFAVKTDTIEKAGSLSQVMVEVGFVVDGQNVTFRSNSRSLTSSVVGAMLEAFAFYINCEKAFLKLRKNALDGKNRNRGDIESESVYKMSMLTTVNNYEKSIKQYRN